MYLIHQSEAAAKALFTIISVMLHFTGQATDSSRVTFEFTAKKSYLCCLTSVKCTGTFTSPQCPLLFLLLTSQVSQTFNLFGWFKVRHSRWKHNWSFFLCVIFQFFWFFLSCPYYIPKHPEYTFRLFLKHIVFKFLLYYVLILTMLGHLNMVTYFISDLNKSSKHTVNTKADWLATTPFFLMHHDSF